MLGSTPNTYTKAWVDGLNPSRGTTYKIIMDKDMKWKHRCEVFRASYEVTSWLDTHQDVSVISISVCHVTEFSEKYIVFYKIPMD